ncbi:MAG TPA: hypothetical protein VFZ34_15075 [Blastocatellia bacterium]|nr:hypothetical protein [Blastocatellia bacterium]
MKDREQDGREALMGGETKHIYEFGSFRLDARERLLQRDGATIALTPKVSGARGAARSNAGTSHQTRRLGLTVSPDGCWLLYTRIDQSGSDIMLMENFR